MEIIITYEIFFISFLYKLKIIDQILCGTSPDDNIQL